MKPLFYFDQRKLRPTQSKNGSETPFFKERQPIVFNPYFRNPSEESKTFDSVGVNEFEIPRGSYQDQEYVSSGSENTDILATSDAPKPRFFSRCESFGDAELGAVTKAQQKQISYPSFGG